MGIKGKLSLATLALLFASCAQANVVYDWQPTSSGTYVDTIDGQIIVTDDAYRSGGLEVHYGPESATPLNFEYADSPLIHAGLLFDLHDEGGSARVSADAEPRTEYFSRYQVSVDAALSFAPGGQLAGYLDIFDLSENFDSQGVGDSWAVGDVNSDYFRDKCSGSSATPCSGGTGYWQLDASSVPDVPEPASWALFGIALAGMGAAYRKRRTY